MHASLSLLSAPNSRLSLYQPRARAQTLCDALPVAEAQATLARLDALPAWAFRLLASRPVVKLFSELFLFAASASGRGSSGRAGAKGATAADAAWLDAACHEAQDYETRHAIWR